MQFEQLARMIAELPGASLDTDNYGQVIVYTGYEMSASGELVPYSPEEEKP